ncbi:MAG: hypothetical protein MJ245_06675 [Clostridia bacterium]|nr:hypothetical protein [Clostridia bacterium]
MGKSIKFILRSAIYYSLMAFLGISICLGLINLSIHLFTKIDNAIYVEDESVYDLEKTYINNFDALKSVDAHVEFLDDTIIVSYKTDGRYITSVFDKDYNFMYHDNTNYTPMYGLALSLCIILDIIITVIISYNLLILAYKMTHRKHDIIDVEKYRHMN